MHGGCGWKIEFHFFQKVTTFLVEGTLWDTKKIIFRMKHEKSNRCPGVFRIWVKKARPQPDFGIKVDTGQQYFK